MGSVNKISADVAAKLEALDCDPHEGMARVAKGNIPCLPCNETGMVPLVKFYTLIGSKLPPWMAGAGAEEELDVAALTKICEQETLCPICGGTGLDPVDVKTRAAMFKELGQYVAPKRKAIEVSQGAGDPLQLVNPDQLSAMAEAVLGGGTKAKARPKVKKKMVRRRPAAKAKLKAKAKAPAKRSRKA